MRGSIAKLCRAHTSYRRRVRSSDRLSQADSTMWRQMNVRSRVSHLRLDQGLHFLGGVTHTLYHRRTLLAMASNESGVGNVFHNRK